MRGRRAVTAAVVCVVVLALMGREVWLQAANARAEGPAASMPPAWPSNFSGTVKVNGRNVAEGTLIGVRNNGVVYAYTTATVWENLDSTYSVYALNVPADSLETPERDGGTMGETLEFTIGGLQAEQTAQWHSGQSQELDLTASALLCYLPMTVR